jgi:Uma2 family endonuclease
MTQQQSKHQAKVKLTVADYMNTPDGVRYQLIDGELILAPSPTDKHQALCVRLTVALFQFVQQRHLGEIRVAPLDVILAEHEVFQPDILFVSNDRREIMTPANIQGAPDLVVEILSPSTRRNDRGHKLDVYSRYGVREYWIWTFTPGTGCGNTGLWTRTPGWWRSCRLATPAWRWQPRSPLRTF